MNLVKSGIAGIAAAFLAVATVCISPTFAEEENVQWLFAISASSGVVDGNKLKLSGIAPLVYFSDRPERITGTVTALEFVSVWNGDLDINDPPKALLSVIADDGVNMIVVELANPSAAEDYIEFDFQVLQGELPAGTFGSSSLVIDPINQNGQWTGT